MRLEVLLTRDAQRDLEDLHAYIASSDSTAKADYVLDRLLEVTDSLAASSRRGSLSKELRSLGIREYLQVFFKPYRVIYRVFEKRVVAYVIADSRRDMQSLLSRRLLGA